ncbi:MAG: hypothetical protein ABW203_03035 [Novosphingobium sp.]
MRKLSKAVLAALVTTTALGAALPAQAQPYPQDRRGDRYDNNHDNRYDQRRTPVRADVIRNQIAELQRRVERNDRRDRISEREAAGLRRDVYRLRDQFRDYNRNGLSNREIQVLDQQIDRIRARLHIERNDWDNRRW